MSSKVKFICKYCGYTWEDIMWNIEYACNKECKKCKDCNIEIKKINEDEKIDTYAPYNKKRS